jgi:hypothetical protein
MTLPAIKVRKFKRPIKKGKHLPDHVPIMTEPGLKLVQHIIANENGNSHIF